MSREYYPVPDGEQELISRFSGVLASGRVRFCFFDLYHSDWPGMEIGNSTALGVMNKINSTFMIILMSSFTFVLMLPFIDPPHYRDYRAEGSGLIENGNPAAQARSNTPHLPVDPATDATDSPGQSVTAENEAKALTSPDTGETRELPAIIGRNDLEKNKTVASGKNAGELSFLVKWRGALSGSPRTGEYSPAPGDQQSSGTLLHRGDQPGLAVAAGLTTTVETVTTASVSPVLSTPPNAAMLGKERVAFTWTGVSGASAYRYRIQVSKNSRFTPTVIDAVAKTGSYKTRAALASGVYYWRVRTADKVKSNGTWSPSWKFTVDTKAPTNTTAKKFINGGKKVTTAAMVSLAVSATDKIGITAYHVSERKKKPSVSDPDWVEIASTKSYAAKIGYTLSGKGDGKKMVYVRFKDAAGNVSQTTNSAIILHTSKPETTITRQPANPTNSTSASFGFVSDKRGARFRCSLDSGDYSACIFNSMSYKDLSAGPHTFNVKAIDNVGNAEQTPASYTWTIDTLPPDTAITTQPTLTANSPSASFGFSSTKTASLFHCKLDDGSYAECVSPLTYTALAEGSHAFFVRATDGAGNIDPTPASYTWTIALFHTAITSQPPYPSNSTTAIFSFTSKKSGATYQCKLDNVDFSACTSPATYTELAEGSHSFSVKAIDEFGIEDDAPAQYTWVINLPPIVKTPRRFINNVSGYVTDKNTVSLALAAASAKGVAGYYASENPNKPDAADSRWIKISRPTKEFSRVVPFTLSNGKGAKTVYVWFKDAEGNVSDDVRDSIYLFNSNYVLLLFIIIQATLLL